MVVALGAVGAAVVLVLATRGSFARVIEARVTVTWALVVGALLQVVGDLWEPGDSWGGDIGFGVVLLSYLLLMVFAASNLHLRGMGVVVLGLALNATVIAVNQGMPVRLPDDATRAQREAIEDSAKHHVERESDHLTFLADIIPLPGGDLAYGSFGDLILAVGFVDVVVQQARGRRYRRPWEMGQAVDDDLDQDHDRLDQDLDGLDLDEDDGDLLDDPARHLDPVDALTEAPDDAPRPANEPDHLPAAARASG